MENNYNIEYNINTRLYSIEYVLIHGYYHDYEYNDLLEELEDLRFRVDRQRKIDQLLN